MSVVHLPHYIVYKLQYVRSVYRFHIFGGIFTAKGLIYYWLYIDLPTVLTYYIQFQALNFV